MGHRAFLPQKSNPLLVLWFRRLNGRNIKYSINMVHKIIVVGFGAIKRQYPGQKADQRQPQKNGPASHGLVSKKQIALMIRAITKPRKKA
jgi:hypothetical protein